MLEIDLNNILPEEDALQKITDIFAKVENDKETYILTKAGRPVLAIIDIDHLEQNLQSIGISTDSHPVSPLAEITPSDSPMPEPAPQTVLNMPHADDQPSVAMMDNVTLPEPDLTSTVEASQPTSFNSSASESFALAPEIPAPALDTTPTTSPYAAENMAPVTEEVPAANPVAEPAPAASASLPTISGSLDLPDMPAEDPTNSSPLG